MKRKLAIGTAQFGLDYGLSNKKGKVNISEVNKVLNFAKENRLYYLDTSQNYGNSEVILGKSKNKNFKIITKINLTNIKLENESTKNIENLVLKSLKNLKVKKIYAILLQDANIILMKNGIKIYNALNYLKKRKLISKFGYSIYNFKNLNNLCTKYKPDLIQCPFNIFDRRLLKNKNLSFLKKKKIEIHVRSIFLQGLLLSSKNKKIMNKFREFNNLFQNYNFFLKKNKISDLEACLSFVSKYKKIDKVIVGIDSLNQLKKIYDLRLNTSLNFPKYISSSNSKLIDPRNWKR
jgi:aryl-alcohol dehydrogenase-like predicted oxidoreductase